MSTEAGRVEGLARACVEQCEADIGGPDQKCQPPSLCRMCDAAALLREQERKLEEAERERDYERLKAETFFGAKKEAEAALEEAGRKYESAIETLARTTQREAAVKARVKVLEAALRKAGEKAAWILEHGATNEVRDLCEHVIRLASTPAPSDRCACGHAWTQHDSDGCTAALHNLSDCRCRSTPAPSEPLEMWIAALEAEADIWKDRPVGALLLHVAQYLRQQHPLSSSKQGDT